jgi:arginase
MIHPIAIVGSPTSLGGHFPGQERTAGELRRHGILDALRARPGLAGVSLTDAGDAPIEAGWAPDPDPIAKNRARICRYLPDLTATVRGALTADARSRLLLLGGDCTSHTAAMAGLVHAGRATGREPRIAIAWYDAHGDINTPQTTRSGNVWGMPFAMLLGHGDADLVGACEGPTARWEDAALLGGQVLDEPESRLISERPMAHFGAGMLGTEAGMAALRAWIGVVGARVDGLYIAFDLDAIDQAEGLSLTMPEPGGLSLATAVESVRVLAGGARVIGFGATTAYQRDGVDFRPTVEAIARLAEAALG